MKDDFIGVWYWFEELEKEKRGEKEKRRNRPQKRNNGREKFVREFRDTIIDWVELHKKDILDYRSYRWRGKTYEESVKARNALEKAIKLSRCRNNGGIDLETADKIYMWGFGKRFPLRDEQEVVEATREAYQFLDDGDCYRACKRLMRINGVGVAGATKLLGLSDQENFCIYDSRVGNALSDLRKDGEKIILCPPGRTTIKGDSVSPVNAEHEWAENYQKLVWTLEIIRECLKAKSHNCRIADIEMTLFMMGRS